MKTNRSFARKVRNRKFAIDNSWKNDCSKQEETLLNTPIQEDTKKWRLLNENLEEANAVKYYDGYPVISSDRKRLGKVIILLKRAIRKIIRHTLGWYIFPFYQRYSHFAGKMVNVASVERDIMISQQQQINELSATITDLTQQIAALNETVQILSTEVSEKNHHLCTEIALLQQNEAENKDKLYDEIALLQQNDKETRSKLCTEIALIQQNEKETNNKLSDLSENQDKLLRLHETHTKNESLLKETIDDLQKRLNEQVESLRENDLTLNNEMIEHKALITNHEAYISNATWSEGDNFYHDLEEYFRGERTLIKERQEMYVPFIKEHLQDWSKGTFVDIGSGRGEWLDILKENGAVDYIGIDLSERQNFISRSYGHNVLNEDCITYLKSLQDNSINVISGFQIIEHLSRRAFQELFKQCHRVLKKGGMILFETPNPQNVEVGANTFHLDPTHIKPLNPLYVQYIAERNGFVNTQIIYSSSNFSHNEITEKDTTVFSEALTNKFFGAVNMLFGPKDYCIFAIKE